MKSSTLPVKYWWVLFGAFLYINCNTIENTITSPVENTATEESTVLPETPTMETQNNPPVFPSTINVESTTDLEYDAGQFLTLVGAVTKITITGAFDPDGDTLTYTWKASNGSISWESNSATWIREVFANKVKNGVVEILIDDGRGGTATHTIEFKTM